MKRLFAITLAAMLALPAVVFADAVWYGSLRGNVEFKDDVDAQYDTGGSRWGIKGSSEVSDGLSAVYKFETRVGAGAAGDYVAGQDTNQIYVGLSGGFGNLTVGRVPSAAYNHSGALRDINHVYGGGDVSSRSSGLSYALSSDAASFQVDAIMDGKVDTGRAVDQFSLGMTINLADIGRLGLAYEETKNSMTDNKVTGAVIGTSTDSKFAVKADKVDLSGLVARDKTTGKVIPGTITGLTSMLTAHKFKDGARVKSKFNDGNSPALATVHDTETFAVELVQINRPAVTGEAALQSGEPSGYRKVDGKYYHKSCVTDGKLNTGKENTCTDKGWAYVRTVNTHNTGGKVTTTYTAYFADPDDLTKSTEIGTYKQVNDVPKEYKAPTSATYFNSNGTTAFGSTPTSLKAVSYVGLTLYLSAKSDLAGASDDVFMRDGTKFVQVDQVAAAGSTTADLEKDDYVLIGDKLYQATKDVAAGEGVITGSTANLKLVKRTTSLKVFGTDTHPTEVKHTLAVDSKKVIYGHSAMHISAQFDLGAVTLGLGYTEKEHNDPMKKMDDKITYLGASGSLGDAGTTWVMQVRDKDSYTEQTDGTFKFGESSPWTVGLGQSLGDGAVVYLEHQNNDDGNGGATTAGLKIDF